MRLALSEPRYQTALIIGAGSGLSAALARAFGTSGMRIALAARSTDDLGPLCREVGGQAFACDASKRADVEALFGAVAATLGSPDVVLYNASFRTRGAFLELDPTDVEKTLAVTAFG